VLVSAPIQTEGGLAEQSRENPYAQGEQVVDMWGICEIRNCFEKDWDKIVLKEAISGKYWTVLYLDHL
jgi:hypothetical protein